MRLLQRGRRGRKQVKKEKQKLSLQGVAFAPPSSSLSVAIFVQAAAWLLDQLSPL